MAELLEALGWRASLGHGVRLVALVGFTTAMILIAVLLLAYVLSLPIVLVQAAIWAAWLAWLGIIFPRNWRRDLETPCERPYRRAFMREILLGISIAFSQFLRPVVAGVILNWGSLASTDAPAIGASFLLPGAAMIVVGVSTLGVARTLFVYEYGPGEQRVVRAGIYRFVRHPLFLGGALVSLGFAICTGSVTAIELGLLNACVAPAYAHLEDRRCCSTLGRKYVDYIATVGGVVPRWRSMIRPVAHLHQAAGRVDPIVDRADVSNR